MHLRRPRRGAHQGQRAMGYFELVAHTVYRRRHHPRPAGVIDARLQINSSFVDVLTVSFAPFTGETRFLRAGFTLDGTNTRTGSASFALAVVDATVSNGADIDKFQSLFFSQSAVSGTFTFPELFSFRYGEPFNLSFSLFPQMDITGPAGNSASNFQNTLVLTLLSIYSPTMQPVSNPIFTSGSGTQYSTAGVVPEPT